MLSPAFESDQIFNKSYMFANLSMWIDTYGENGTTVTGDMIAVPILWSVAMILGISGNGIVVYVMTKFAEKNSINCYIINLACSDLTFVIIVVPFTMMHYALPQWIFGQAMCKIHMYMIYVSIPIYVTLSDNHMYNRYMHIPAFTKTFL